MTTDHAPHPAPVPVVEQQPVQSAVGRYAWLVLGAVALVGLAAVWQLLPHAREKATLGEFVVRIVVFVFAIGAVATFPRGLRFGWLLASIPFAGFLGFVIPRMMALFLTGPQTQPEYYTYLWSLLYPGILMSLCLAHRIGGGSRGRTVKIGLNGLILLFSGYLELLWFIVNPSWNYNDMGTIPHVEVIIGHFPSYGELFVFALCHLPLLIAVNVVPLDRWIDRLLGPDGPAAVSAPRASASR